MTHKRQKLILVILLSLNLLFLFSSQVMANFEEESFISKLVKHLEKKDEKMIFFYKISYDSIHIDYVNKAIKKAVSSVDDYTKYTIKDWQINIRGNSQEVEVKILVSYYNSAKEDIYVYQRTKDILDKIILPSMNIHQKIKSISDYIAKNVYYDDYQERYSAYDALKGRSTCQGYALLTYLMLKETGIENQIISGQLDGQSHAWNLVKVDGYWYHLDLTQISSYYQEYGELFYSEYLVSDKALGISHNWNYNEYPKANTSYYTQLTRDIQYSNSDLYQQLIKELNLFYLKEDYTVASSNSLRKKLEDLFEAEKEEINLRITDRYLKQNKIVNIINDIFSDNPELSMVYSGWRFNIYPSYIRDELKDSSLVIISLEKR